MAAPLAAAGAARAGALAWSERRWLLWVLVLVFGLPLALVALIAAMVGGLAEQAAAPPVGGYAPSQIALADIPPLYLRTYEAAGAAYGVGWEYLAAIGKVETDHGRSSLPGVQSGVNAYGAAPGRCSSTSATGRRRRGTLTGIDGNGTAPRARGTPRTRSPPPPAI